MLILAIVIAVLAIVLGLLGGFADALSDAPCVRSGVAPIVIGMLIVAAVLFGLWLAGYHFTLTGIDR